MTNIDEIKKLKEMLIYNGRSVSDCIVLAMGGTYRE
jgi:hypothetical protein